MARGHTHTRTRLMSLAIGCAAVGPASPSPAQPVGSPIAPTLENPNRFAVTGVAAARRFLNLTATRRVDLALIGDSNTRQIQVTGHEDGMSRAFAARYSMYATRVNPVAGDGSWGAPVTGETSGQMGPFQTVGEPAEASHWVFSDSTFPSSFALLPAGADTGPSYNTGYFMDLDHPVNVTDPLRYHLTDYPMAGGAYHFSVRAPWPGDAWTNFPAGAPVYTLAPHSLRDISIDVPAGPRAWTGILVCFADLQDGLPCVGPVMPIYHRVENLTRPHGVAYSTMWFQGGQDARRCLEALLIYPYTQTAMIEWMRQATKLQNGPPVLLVHILHGGNDAGDWYPSLGPIGGLPSDTSAGHEDNVRGVILWLRARWLEAGYNPDNLFFLLGPYHPRADRLPVEMGYEQAWRNISASDPQVFTLAGTMLSTAEEFRTKGYFRSTVDEAHLSQPGYLAWGNVTVRALGHAVCPADFDENGSASINDLFAFLGAWFGQSVSADFDYSGAVSVQDLFDFLAAWFAGC